MSNRDLFSPMEGALDYPIFVSHPFWRYVAERIRLASLPFVVRDLFIMEWQGELEADPRRSKEPWLEITVNVHHKNGVDVFPLRFCSEALLNPEEWARHDHEKRSRVTALIPNPLSPKLGVLGPDGAPS